MTVEAVGEPVQRELDLRGAPADQPYQVLGTFRFRLDREAAVTIANGAGGHLHADAVQLVPAPR